MNVRLLVDSIVRQTTVLIAQLATSSGVRAPLANIASDVFLSLSREIESQGVSRRVVADMFGLALRGYQRRVHRLAESASSQGRTLFEAVLAHVQTEGVVSRADLEKRFSMDGEAAIAAVASDLVDSGLLYRTGLGTGALYGVTSKAEQQRLTRESDSKALANMALGEVYRSGRITLRDLARSLAVDESRLEQVLNQLLGDGLLVLDESTRAFSAPTFQIEQDAEEGWESAVFDHFQAVCTAVANKVRLRADRSGPTAFVGGSTMRFEIHRDHPLAQQVLALLAETRAKTEDIWKQVSDYNRAQGTHQRKGVVTFYFGQNLDEDLLSGIEGGEQ